MSRNRAPDILAVIIAGFVFGAPPTLSAQILGHIQVKAEPGVQIFLDGAFKGTTSQVIGGLIIEKIPPGSYTLRAVKPGFFPQEARLSVTKGRVLVYALKPFVPKIQVSEHGEERTDQLILRVGTLIVQSLPVECVIDSPAMGVKSVVKRKYVWSASQIPEGTYEIAFRAIGKTLRYRALIRANETEKLFVNFPAGSVTDVGAEERREEARRKEVERQRLKEQARKARAEEQLRRSEEEQRRKAKEERKRTLLAAQQAAKAKYLGTWIPAYWQGTNSVLVIVEHGENRVKVIWSQPTFGLQDEYIGRVSEDLSRITFSFREQARGTTKKYDGSSEYIPPIWDVSAQLTLRADGRLMWSAVYRDTRDGEEREGRKLELKQK